MVGVQLDAALEKEQFVVQMIPPRVVGGPVQEGAKTCESGRIGTQRRGIVRKWVGRCKKKRDCESGRIGAKRAAESRGHVKENRLQT